MPTNNPGAHSTPPPTDLNGLLAPISPDEFIHSQWSKSHCFVPGWPGKFAALLPWEELNRILEQHRLEAPRLRLVMSDELVDSRFYTDSSRSVPRIMVKELGAQLRAGATLILDRVHELHIPLTSLAESLERQFGVPVGINAYAGWRTSHGYDIHWDDHDVFVLQVFGNKRWLLYGSESKIEGGQLPPNSLWDRILKDGDLLYIPRGTRHVAVPLDQPSLHLTIGIENPVATDFLLWLATEQRFRERPEMVLSRLANAEERLRFLDRLKKEVTKTLTPALLERYFENSDAMRRPYSHFSFPWNSTASASLPDGRALVRLQSRRTLDLRAGPQNKGVRFAFNGKVWRFPDVMKGIFEALERGQTVTVGQLISMLSDAVGEEMARASISTLIKEGIIWIAPIGYGSDKSNS